MLHVTNGDVAAAKIRDAGVQGDVLPWRDVLHEGPVTAGPDAAGLRELRADFIAGRGWAPRDRVLRELEARDRRLDRALAEGEPVLLWFEHDLYDQLQLLQVLDRVAEAGPAGPVELICIGAFPGVERFLGLGQLTPEQMGSLHPRREPVTPEQLERGRRAWAAFRSPDPRGLEAILGGRTDPLPFLTPALRRHLEELPAVGSGLSRTERQAVEALVSGLRTPVDLFRAMQDLEEAPYLGDASFWVVLEGLGSGPRPLTRRADGAPIGRLAERADFERPLALTDDGQRVRRGDADWIDLRGGIDRWLGGVHLEGKKSGWTWNASEGVLIRRS